jgi:hypothetical protein
MSHLGAATRSIPAVNDVDSEAASPSVLMRDSRPPDWVHRFDHERALCWARVQSSLCVLRRPSERASGRI